MSYDSKAMLSPYRWVILVIMWLTIFVAIASQFQLSALAFRIIPDFGLSSGQFAMVLTAPMLPGVLLSLVAGALADKFGVKKVVAFGFVFAVIGTYFRYVAVDFGQLLILMFLSGFAPALLNANAAKLIGAWFPKEQMGTAMGVYFSATGAGIGVALATSALFPSINSAFITAGVLLFLVFILWLAFIKNKPEGAPELPVQPMTKYIGVAAKSKNVWLVGLAMMFFMGANIAFTGFLPNALNEVRGIEPVMAGFMTSMVTLGTIIGSILGPISSNRIGQIKPFVSPVGVLAAIALYGSWVVSDGLSLWVMLFATGIFMGIIPPLLLSYPALLPEIGSVYAGSAGGIIATLQLSGAVVIPSFILPPLAGDNYNMLFLLTALICSILAIIAIFLPELGRKAQGNFIASTSEQNLIE